MPQDLTTDDAKAERSMVREAMMIWFCRIALLLLILSLPWGLSACASVEADAAKPAIPENMVCFEQLLGQTQRPPMYITRHYCVSEEEYALMIEGGGT